MNYFDKIPTITYNGYTVKNLLCRAKISDSSKNNKMLYYPYTMAEDDRADTVSNYYYDSPGYSWLVWMSNDIIDPYYDVPLSYNDFIQFIISKYGSIESSMRKIKFYRNNWYDNTETISIDAFNALAANFKKYYDPVVDNDYIPMGYKRKRHDEIVSTNRILTLEVDSDGFIEGEEINVNGSNYAFCVYSSSGILIVNNVTGAIHTGDTITGTESNKTATVLSSATTSESIASTESTYWSPVTYYDYEYELNSLKKEINLIDSRYRGQVESDFKRLMGAG